MVLFWFYNVNSCNDQKGHFEPFWNLEIVCMHTTCPFDIPRKDRFCMVVLLMTDSICHSSLPRTVLEKVTLTTIQFRIYPRTKVDPMFQCVYISTPLKSCPYKSSATCAWSMARAAKKTRLNICANNKGADQPARPRRLISAFVVRYSSFFFDLQT